MNWREFRFVRADAAPLVWMIRQEGESYFTQHGILEGKLQVNTDTPGPKGKEDTKAYMNAVDNCAFHVSREIRKKTEAGYIEYINGVPQEQRITKIAFDQHLPKVFTGYKPQQNIDNLKLKRICTAGRARYTRKMNGMAHLAVHHTWGWEIYSRRMDKVSDNFPLHVAALKDKFPVGTILVGEMVCMVNGLDDLNTVARICRSDADKARNLVKWGEVPEPNFVVFDMLFYDSMPLNQTSYDKRSALWRGEFPCFNERGADDVITTVDFYDVKHDTWEDYALERKWEGFVVTDGDAIPGDKFFTFNGKAKRPNGHHKLKPVFEADVVVFAGKFGSGKRKDGAGSAFIKQLDPQTGKWFYVGTVGSGFSETESSGNTLGKLQEMLKEHGLPILKKDTDAEKMNIQNDNGFVLLVEYGDRTPGKNKLQFPAFKGFRDDKSVNECEAEWFSSKAEVDLDFLKE